MSAKRAFVEHDVSWTLRSLLAAGLLCLCAVAATMSASQAAKRAEAERRAQLAITEEAELVADLAKYLRDETVAVRAELDAPRLKPANAGVALLAAADHDGVFTEFGFAKLANTKVDAEERRCMAQAIYYEARSEPRVGQLAVADVILNRVDSPIYPNTICDVVYQGGERRTGCQFSFVCDGSMKARLNERKWRASEALAGAILAGLRAPVSRNATHYHANYVTPRWASRLTPTATIGTHKFYKFPSRHAVSAAPAAM